MNSETDPNTTLQNQTQQSLIHKKSVRGPQASFNQSMKCGRAFQHQVVLDSECSLHVNGPLPLIPNSGDTEPYLSSRDFGMMRGAQWLQTAVQHWHLSITSYLFLVGSTYGYIMPVILKRRIDDSLQNSVHEIFMAIITVYILYADDIRTLTDKSNDQGFYVTSFICILIFLLEILVLCIVRKGYLCSFFFWMDLISTLTTFMDIPWVIDGLGLSILSGQSNISKLNKAGRASRVSSRATKIVRIIRLVRIVRISKLYKYAQQSIQERFKVMAKEFNSVNSVSELETPEDNSRGVLNLSPVSKKGSALRDLTPASEQHRSSDKGMMHRLSLFNKQTDNLNMPNQASQEYLDQYSRRRSNQRKSYLITKNPIKVIEGLKPYRAVQQTDAVQLLTEESENYQETRVGKQLSDQITKKAILLMLSVIVCIPLFDYSTYWLERTAYESFLNMMYQNKDDNYLLSKFLEFNESTQPRMPISYIAVDNQIIYQSQYVSTEYRLEELQLYASSHESYVMVIVYEDTQLNAILGICMTTFVIIMMVSGAVFFNKDSNDLVVVPIENMLSKVRRISRNPLEAAKIEEDQEILEQELRQTEDKKRIREHLEQNTYETAVLERLIIRTGSLLAIGFGQAGGAIIAENLKKGDAVNPLIQGNKMVAIFGFCDIRNFTDMTEILQEDVMLFVNDIAHIVHTNVHTLHGSANKNIGDAFLLVWRFPDEILQLLGNEEYGIRNISAVNNFADLALLSFIRIMIQVKKSRRLAKLRDIPLVAERLPGYQVKLGYGLHLGWAIEGAIGSTFKIDASYLSPNVNMAARLETATKQYGTSLLLSGQFYHFLSQQVKEYVRFIDKITVKGSTQPIDLFTFDGDLSLLGLDPEASTVPTNTKLIRYIKRKKLKEQYNKIIESRFKIYSHYAHDLDIKIIRKPYTEEFHGLHEQGMEQYLLGGWERAAQYFKGAFDIIPHDGPTTTIMEFMKEYNFRSPETWKGYRELTDK